MRLSGRMRCVCVAALLQAIFCDVSADGVESPYISIAGFNETMTMYPGFENVWYHSWIVGSVTVASMSAAGDSRVLVQYNLQGLVPGITAGIHVHEGTNCSTNAAVGGHLWQPTIAPDPWTVATYTADSNGLAAGSFTIAAGYDAAQLRGRTVVIHGASLSDTAERVACSVLSIPQIADMDRYPGYTSEYPNPRGFVVSTQVV